MLIVLYNSDVLIVDFYTSCTASNSGYANSDVCVTVQSKHDAT